MIDVNSGFPIFLIYAFLIICMIVIGCIINKRR